MPAQSITDTALIDKFAEVFSRHGYEGASLNLLSEASGLKRSSLYHRFPNGKDEIVTAVAARVGERFNEVLAPAFDEGDPYERALEVAAGIREYYKGGAQSCLIVALSVASEPHRAAGAACVRGWASALKNLAIDSGFDVDAAADVALDIVAAIEGSLVIAATSGNTRPFERALDAMPQRLTELPS